MPRTLTLLLASAAALAAVLPPKTFAQTASAPAADDAALRNIQSNFARMAPPPRTMQSINQDLQQHRKPSGKRPDGAPGRGRKPPPPDSANADGKPPAPPDGPPPSDAPPPDGPPSATNP
ncbi:signal peptidase [Ralstonia pseudosolanacearum]